TRILHVLDHSLPLGSGYSYRSRSIVRPQRRLGLEPVVLTPPKQGSAQDSQDVLDDIVHYRTGRTGGRLPVVRELLLMRRLAARIEQGGRAERRQGIHAASRLLDR